MIGTLGLVLIPSTLDYISIFYLLVTFLGAGSSLSFFSIKEIIDINKSLKSNYSNFNNLDNDELYNIKSDKMNRIDNMDHELVTITDKITKCNSELSKINRFEKAISIFEDPYYMADTKEEFQILNDIKSDDGKIVKSYLEESVDYSNVYFNNLVDNTSKKLIKKR